MYFFIDILFFPQKVILGFYEKNHFFLCTSKKIPPEKMLIFFNNVLEKKSWEISDISGIIVFFSNGGFSNSRMACVYGNIFAELLGVPVLGCPLTLKSDSWKSYRDHVFNLLQGCVEDLKGQKNISFLFPHYNKEPNITYPKQVA